MFADVVQWCKDNSPESNPIVGVKDEFAKTQITDYKVDGEKATAVVKRDGKAVGTTYFKKIDGKWYFDFALAVMMQKKQAKSRKPKSSKTH